MQLDIRIPMAYMFSLLGAILAVYGFMNSSHPEIQQRSLGVNVNLWWGLAMIVFGITMWLWARMGKVEEDKPAPKAKGADRR
jgi:hypothetical protein